MLADHRDGLSIFKFLAWSSIAQSVCQRAFSLLAIWCLGPRVQILHSAEEHNLSPFDLNIACLCQSIEINNNKYVFTQLYFYWLLELLVSVDYVLLFPVNLLCKFWNKTTWTWTWQEGSWCSSQCWLESILDKFYSREGQNSRCLERQSLQSDSPGWEQQCVWSITSWWAWPRPDSEQGKYESLYSSPVVRQLPNILPYAQSQSLSSDASDESSTDSEELPTVDIHLPGRRIGPPTPSSSESDDDAEPSLRRHTTRDTAGGTQACDPNNFHSYPRSFGLRVLSSPASVCVYLCVCQLLLVCAITHHPLKLGSPNLDQKMQNILLKVPIVLGPD